MNINFRNVNRVLVRVLVVSLIIFGGALYQTFATDISAITGITISGNLYVTSTITVSGNEGNPAPGSLIFWDGASCPSGWTEVSATYPNKFPLGGTTAGSTGGSDTHSHSGSHTHGGSALSVGTTSHTHTVGGTDDSISHSHTKNSCGALTDSGGGTSFGTGGGSTDSPSHNHNGYTTYTTDAADSHSHSMSSATSAPGQSSSTDSNVPVYMTLKLCKKW